MYSGDITLGSTIDIGFSTVNQYAVPTTLAGSPVISAYVGNGTTEITAGITLSVDFDSRTGYHNVRIVATSGNGFAAATDVSLVITTGTVNSISVVGARIGSFSIDNRSVAAALARLPAALVGGRIDASVGAMAASVLNAAAIAADAITDAKVAADVTIAAVTGAVGSVTAGVTLTNVQGVKKNTARKFGFVLYDAAGAPKAGVTVTVQRSLDGATSWSSVTGTVAEIANGAYVFSASAADLNADDGIFRFSGSGAVDGFLSFNTQQA